MDALAVRRHNNQRQADEVAPTRTAVLHLRPAPTAEEVELAQRQQEMRVTWDPAVREPQNQQVSKCCCVFHKKKLFGESSSDSSSSSDDSDDEHDSMPLPSGAGDHHGEDAGMAAHAHSSECGHGCGHDDHSKKRRRPKCTKDHCYCGTTFH